MDLSFSLEDTHVLITGGTGFIGAATVNVLLAAGARVTSLDLKAPPRLESPKFRFLSCDISSEEELTFAFRQSAKAFGPVATCIALASLDLSVLDHHESLVDMDVEQWRKTHRVNVEGTFLTARTWLRGLKAVSGTEEAASLKNVSLIIIGSESGWFGERGNADYSAGKSAVQGGLLKSLVGDVSRVWPGARVNAVAPGPVDTAQFKKECEENPNQYYLDAQATYEINQDPSQVMLAAKYVCSTGLKRPVPPNDVAKSILFLASENWSGSITGQVLNVDCGKQGKVTWTKEELHSN